ncbi:MAG TPA: class I SAM-dependent methyltransferase [Thermoanaerobaculia bacterium]|nr:class I SAM-dependent methyltransferase [Thermoanaerobaculia bacterium]
MNGTIFDIGGGNGIVARGLASAGFDVVLVEPGLAGARNARHRGVKRVVCATLEAARFEPASLPACGLFDVLEHIADDRDFLATIRSLLQPEGRLYITVPAYSWLWSAEDDLAGHFRRYRLRTINRLLREVGFEVEFSSYFFRLVPLAIFFMRTLPTMLGIAQRYISSERVRRDHVVFGRRFSELLRPLLSSELRRLSGGLPVRFGGSCLTVARRPVEGVDRPPTRSALAS